MPRKTFHFEPDEEKVLTVLVDLYMQSTALVEALQGILEERGYPTPWARRIVTQCDKALVHLLRNDSNEFDERN